MFMFKCCFDLDFPEEIRPPPFVIDCFALLINRTWNVLPYSIAQCKKLNSKVNSQVITLQ
jgi:hypothetical protein